MAKKTVASLQKGEGRNYAKVIKFVRSDKSGSYALKEEMVLKDQLKEVLKK